MTKLQANFCSSTGVLRSNDHVLASPGLARPAFDRSIAQDMTPLIPTTDFTLYSPFWVELWGECFIAGIRFFQDVIHGVTLTLEQSKVDALGYDATENDLLAEKKKLVAILSKQLACSPSTVTLGADVFAFSWGGVISRADLKSTWCGIEIRYL